MTTSPIIWPTRKGGFALGDLAPLKGCVLRGARLCLSTQGTLSAAWDNVIVYPNSDVEQTRELTWLIGTDGFLDTGRWFNMQLDIFGNWRFSAKPVKALRAFARIDGAGP